MQSNSEQKKEKPYKAEKRKIKSEYEPDESGHFASQSSNPFYDTSKLNADELRHLELFSQLPQRNEKTKGVAAKRKYSDEINNNDRSLKKSKDKVMKVSKNSYNEQSLNNLFSPPKLFPNNSLPVIDKAVKELYETTMLNNISPMELTKVNEALVTSIASEMQRLEKQKMILEEKLKKASADETTSNSPGFSTSGTNHRVRENTFF